MKLLITGSVLLAAACTPGSGVDEPVRAPTEHVDPIPPSQATGPSDPASAAHDHRATRIPLARGDARGGALHLSTVSSTKPAAPSLVPDVPLAPPPPTREEKANDTLQSERARAGDQLPPEEQGNSDVDLMLTERIRKAIADSAALSPRARGIGVATLGGKVTLRGTVKNEEVRKALGDIARKVAGAGNVENLLEVDE